MVPTPEYSAVRIRFSRGTSRELPATERFFIIDLQVGAEVWADDLLGVVGELYLIGGGGVLFHSDFGGGAGGRLLDRIPLGDLHHLSPPGGRSHRSRPGDLPRLSRPGGRFLPGALWAPQGPRRPERCRSLWGVAVTWGMSPAVTLPTDTVGVAPVRPWGPVAPTAPWGPGSPLFSLGGLLLPGALWAPRGPRNPGRFPSLWGWRSPGDLPRR